MKKFCKFPVKSIVVKGTSSVEYIIIGDKYKVYCCKKYTFKTIVVVKR